MPFGTFTILGDKARLRAVMKQVTVLRYCSSLRVRPRVWVHVRTWSRDTNRETMPPACNDFLSSGSRSGIPAPEGRKRLAGGVSHRKPGVICGAPKRAKAIASPVLLCRPAGA
jgi:hypothetical protein